MDRRRMMMDGKQFLLVFTLAEGAENCFVEIGGKRVSAGNHKVKKGEKVICGISTPPKARGEILFGGEIVAETQDKFVSQTITYEFAVQSGVSVTAEGSAFGGGRILIEEN